MTTADRLQWQAARSLGGIARLSALRLVPVLVALCRAGYLTTASRPGDGPAERAAVEGLASAELADRIALAGEAAGLIVIAHPPADLPNCRWHCGLPVTVTRTGGREETEFGERLSTSQIADRRRGWGMCHPDAVAALCGAWQVTLADPRWGRPDLLWRTLAGAVRLPAPGPERGVSRPVAETIGTP
jgi:hypothetical protein